MDLTRLLKSFLHDSTAPTEIDGRHVQTDPDLAGRNADRALLARQRLGEKWIGARKVGRINRRDYDDFDARR